MNKEALQQLAAFDEPFMPKDWRDPARRENARLRPLIDALIDDREALRTELERVIDACANKPAIHAKPAVALISRQALAASDERLLKLGAKGGG